MNIDIQGEYRVIVTCAECKIRLRFVGKLDVLTYHSIENYIDESLSRYNWDKENNLCEECRDK